MAQVRLTGGTSVLDTAAFPIWLSLPLFSHIGAHRIRMWVSTLPGAILRLVDVLLAGNHHQYWYARFQ